MSGMRTSLQRLSCLGEALRDGVSAFKSNVALIEIDRHRETCRYTYADLRVEAERFAARLQATGFGAGDRLAILMSNQSRWVIGGLGGLWAGAVLVPLDYKLTAKEQLALLRHARPRALLIEYPLLSDILRQQPDALAAMHVIVSEPRKGANLGGAVDWELPDDSTFTYVPRTRQDLACIVYSSGTGGRPKGCMLIHDNYLEQADVLSDLFPMREDDSYFSVLPTNHAVDFMCGMIIPFLFGASVVHQRTLRPEYLASTMKRYRVTHTALVPRILKNLRQRIEESLDELPEWKRTLLSGLMDVNELATLKRANSSLSRALLKPLHDRFGGRLRVIVAGGAFIEPELAQFFNRIGLPIWIGYGLTEACTVLTINDLAPFRATTVGKPVRGVEIELRDFNDEGIGEVYARGRTIMAGYLDDPETTRETLVDGWLRTGDLGRMDASGHLQLIGRQKNMIVTEGGKNIYPEDVEGAFEAVPCEELCVFSERYLWPIPGLGREGLTLVVRPRKRQRVSELLDLVRSHNQQLVDFKRIGSYVLWNDEFPRTASMKIKRPLLADALRNQVQAATPL